MTSNIQLLNYNTDTHQIEEEEKAIFLRTLLEQCFENTPTIEYISTIYGTTNEPLSVSKKMELRGILTANNLIVIDGIDGSLRVYLSNKEIGGFDKPTYKLRQDLSAIDSKKRVYIEMKTNFWSVFDQV
jgi:hypothetical protein